MKKSLYSKMRKIPTNSKWIRVDSSFGGLAIYKKEILKGTKYQGLDKYGQEICEHISLNLDLNKKGYKIYINPKLVTVPESVNFPSPSTQRRKLFPSYVIAT